MLYGSLSGTSLRHIVVAVSFTLVTLAAHWGLWRWLAGMWPGWMRRNRWHLLAILVVAWAFPLIMPKLWPAPPSRFTVRLVAVAMLWQFVIAAAVLGLWSARATARLAARTVGMARQIASKVSPPATGAPSPINADANGAGVAELADAPAPTTPQAVSRRVFFERTCGLLALGASASALGWAMVRGRREWSIEDVPIRLCRLPRVLDGFTIVQISDLHVGAFIGEYELADGLSRIAALKPDLIVVTGDILDRDPRYIPLAARHLGQLRARLGVACVPGNHDHYTGAELVLDGMRRAGLMVLCNEGRVLLPHDGGGIALLGVDDLAGARMVRGGGPDLETAKSRVPPDCTTVLLAHQPTYAESVTGAGIDLQLSGHTHGGQINPGFPLASLISPYVAGTYDVQGTTLYVNRGFGTVGPPARLGAPPEITRMILVSS